MPDLVFDISCVLDRVRHLIAQQPSVTLPHVVQLFLHRGFSYAQGGCKIRIRHIGPFRREVAAERVEKPEPSIAFTFLAQAPQRSVHARRMAFRD